MRGNGKKAPLRLASVFVKRETLQNGLSRTIPPPVDFGAVFGGEGAAGPGAGVVFGGGVLLRGGAAASVFGGSALAGVGGGGSAFACVGAGSGVGAGAGFVSLTAAVVGVEGTSSFGGGGGMSAVGVGTVVPSCADGVVDGFVSSPPIPNFKKTPIPKTATQPTATKTRVFDDFFGMTMSSSSSEELLNGSTAGATARAGEATTAGPTGAFGAGAWVTAAARAAAVAVEGATATAGGGAGAAAGAAGAAGVGAAGATSITALESSASELGCGGRAAAAALAAATMAAASGEIPPSCVFGEIFAAPDVPFGPGAGGTPSAVAAAAAD